MSYQPPQDPSQPPVVHGAAVPADPTPPPAYPAQQVYMQPIVVSGPPVSPYAVASLVLGIIETNNNAKSGRGMAIAGLIMGYLMLAPVVVVIATGGIGRLLHLT